MFYIGLTKNLSTPAVMDVLKASLSQQDDSTSDKKEEDGLLVFFKDADSLKMADFASMLEAGVVPTACERVADRDDMLVLLGAHLAQTEGNVTLLDSSIPVPKRYEKRVKTLKVKAAAKPRARRKTSAKTAVTDAADGEKVDDEETAAQDTKKKTAEKTHTRKSTDKHIGQVTAENPEEPVSVQEKWRKKMDSPKPFMPTPEIPADLENEPVFSYPEAEAVYNIVKLKAEDVGFSLSTEFLMGNIIRDVEGAETDEDVKMSILARHNGDKIWEKVKGHIQEIRKACK